jgi:hypothetical protein
MPPFVVAEQGHVVSILPPFASNAATYDSDVWCMRDYSHVSIILTIGTTGGSCTAILYELEAVAGTPDAIAAAVYKEESVLGDTLGVRVAMTTTGFNTHTNANIFYVIEFDAADMSEGHEWLQLKISALDNTTLISGVAILSGARYASPESATEVA